MIYVLGAVVIVTSVILVACTAIYIDPKGEAPITVQTSNSTNAIGSQNVAKDDTQTDGDVQDGDGTSSQGATATPTITVPINNPVGGQ